jgi:hypothetical protein
MHRPLSLLALLIATAAAWAQPPSPVKKLSVTPAAEPKPALRYQFLPPLRDQVPGNAAVHYYRAAQVRPAPGSDRDKFLAEDKQVQGWEEAEIEKLPVKEVREYLDRYKAMFREVEEGARCDRCEWQYDPQRGMSVLDTLLPSVQTHREVTRYLSLRIKLELAEKRYDDAAKSLATGLTLGKRVGEGPTLIQMLVGIAISHVYLGRVEDLIRRPGSPNLYWALTSLPRPFIDPRPSLEGESKFFDAFAPGYDEMQAGPVKPERAQELAERTIKALRSAGEKDDDPAFTALDGLLGKVGFAAYVALHFPAAKQELIDRGRPAKEVEAMPATQVVVLNSLERVKVMADDQTKWFLVGGPDGWREIQRLSERARKMRAGSDALFNVFSLGLPATEKVYFAHARCERTVAALRAVEAVRLHAAANKGAVPGRLEDVTLVPVPADPFTGKPFEYSASGNTFTLIAPPPVGHEPHAGNTIHYVVTIAKQQGDAK